MFEGENVCGLQAQGDVRLPR